MGIILIGAGNHCKVVIDILKEQKKEITGIVDDNRDLQGKSALGIKVIGSTDKIYEYDKDNYQLIITIGNVKARKNIFETFIKCGYTFTNAIHPNSCISKHTMLNKGIIINSGVRIHPDVNIGDNVIVGLNSTISHDTVIGEHCHISPGVNLAGEVIVEECVDIGLNSAVIPGKKIGNNSVIGAGAIVTKDIPPNCTAVGVPAKPIKYHDGSEDKR